MKDSIYRKDLNYFHFELLLQFKIALDILGKRNHIAIQRVEKKAFQFPLWSYYKSDGRWRIDSLKKCDREVFFIKNSDFRRVCKYIRLTPKEVIKILIELSVVALNGYDQGENKFSYKFKMNGKEGGYLFETRRLLQREMPG